MKQVNKILKASDDHKAKEYEDATKPLKKVFQTVKPSEAIAKGSKITFKIK